MHTPSFAEYSRCLDRGDWLEVGKLMPAVVADSAVARGFNKVGITGTRRLVDSEVYPETCAIE